MAAVCGISPITTQPSKVARVWDVSHALPDVGHSLGCLEKLRPLVAAMLKTRPGLELVLTWEGGILSVCSVTLRIIVVLNCIITTLRIVFVFIVL